MRLTKHHGFLNDFLVALVDEVPENAHALALAWCHRLGGIGADGLIFGTPADDADLTMTLFNADGGRAEISGNGIRCLAQAVLRRDGGDELDIATDGGVRRLSLVTHSGDWSEIRVEMGQVGPGPDLVDITALVRPEIGLIRAETAEVGNPHVVLEVGDIDAVDPAIDGPAIEAAWMPEGINVHFMTTNGDDAIRLIHWERGSGVTAACGSGATVSATIANRWGLVAEHVRVAMPGGSASVDVGSPAHLTGEAVFIADIDAPVPAGVSEAGVPAQTATKIEEAARG